MTKKKDQKQTTRKGYEIPIPTRKDFFNNMEKTVKKKPDQDEESIGRDSPEK